MVGVSPSATRPEPTKSCELKSCVNLADFPEQYSSCPYTVRTLSSWEEDPDRAGIFNRP